MKTTCTMCTWLFATLYLCFTALLFVGLHSLLCSTALGLNSVRHCPLHHPVLQALGLNSVRHCPLHHLVLHALGLKQCPPLSPCFKCQALVLPVHQPSTVLAVTGGSFRLHTLARTIAWDSPYNIMCTCMGRHAPIHLFHVHGSTNPHTFLHVHGSTNPHTFLHVTCCDQVLFSLFLVCLALESCSTQVLDFFFPRVLVNASTLLACSMHD